MSTAGSETGRIRFGEFEADLRTQELFRGGQRLRLPNQSFVMLAILLERPGQLVTRDELRARLWPDNRVVDFEQGLNAIVNRLRDALGDRAESAKFVETLPRRGYRFIAPVQSTPPQPTPEPAPSPDTVPPVIKEQAPPEGPHTQRRAAVLLAAVALSAVAVAAVSRYLPSRSAADSTAKPTPFTSLIGQELAPAFSPEGTRIAFAWNGDAPGNAGFDLYVKALDSERLLRLTHQPATALAAAWSPDGTRIAFARWSDRGSGIFVMPALGGEERKVASAEFSAAPIMQVSWSPDAKLLAYSAVDKEGAHVIRTLRLDDLSSQPLPSAPECWHAGTPAFSPDGRQLAFVCISSVAVYGIHVVAFPSGSARLVTSMLGEPKGLAWSRDGKDLLVANDSGEGGSLWQVSLDGRTTQLAPGTDAWGVAAHDNRIAYVRGGQVVDIWRVDLAALQPAQAERKLIFSTRVQMLPQFSPDATRIVFQSNRSGSFEIWTADADGTNPVRLTTFNGPLTGAPAWCSDGRRIAFDSRASGTSAIYVMDVEERLPRRIAASRENISLPAWSEDCRWLFASNGRQTLYRIPAAGGQAELFTQQRSYYAVVAGDRVVFNVARPTDVQLWSKPVAGGEEVPLAGMPKLAYADSWVATRAGVYYTTSASNSSSLSFYDFETGKTRVLTNLQQAPTPLGGLGMSVSGDGRALLYTRTGDVQSDIMLISSK